MWCLYLLLSRFWQKLYLFPFDIEILHNCTLCILLACSLGISHESFHTALGGIVHEVRHPSRTILKNLFCFVFLQTSSRSAKAPKRLAKKQDPDLMGSESISSIFYRHRFTRKNKRNRWSRKTSGFKKRNEKKRERLASLHLLLFLDPHRASRRFALSGHTARC